MLNKICINVYIGEIQMSAFYRVVRDKSSKNDLTKRELNCLSWIADGKTNGEIARSLGLSEHVVVLYLASAIGKLGAANRTHAVAKAIRLGLLD